MIYKLLVALTLFGGIFNKRNNMEINHDYLNKQIELSVKHFQSEHEDYKKENYFNYLDKWRTEIIKEPKLFSTTFRVNKNNRFDVGYGYHWESIYEVFYKYYEIYKLN